ncbi:MAG: urea carboxylase-associated family protein [Thaumarchaeota archaeon]|nr:urea carboxylase-associated family protein [Nitrososphaerota archaeon]
MKVVNDFLIPARTGKAVVINKGEVLRIIEEEGKQVADVIIFNADDHKEKFDLSHTVRMNCVKGIGNLKRVKELYSQPSRSNIMFTIMEDKVGVHGLITGNKCSIPLYRARDKLNTHANCQDNLSDAIRPYGLTPDDVGDVFNVFMNLEVDERNVPVIKSPVSKKGDYIDMKAEMDCLVAISACPGDTQPTNDYLPKSLRIQALQ